MSCLDLDILENHACLCLKKKSFGNLSQISVIFKGVKNIILKLETPV